MAGSSRPASGSEHLISHALDSLSARPRLHGLQVGVASYLVSLLQGRNSQLIAELFERTGFWEAIASDPFSKDEWNRAVELAPGLKHNFHTVLSDPKSVVIAKEFLKSDDRLRQCVT